jgi:hypothetical protein
MVVSVFGLAERYLAWPPDSRMATLGFKNKYPVRIFQRAIEEEVNKF